MILAETVSVEHPYEKRRILRRYPPAYPPTTTGVERLLVNGKVNRQESARQPRTVQNCFVKALLARASHQNRGGKWDVAHFDLVDDIQPGVLPVWRGLLREGSVSLTERQAARDDQAATFVQRRDHREKQVRLQEVHLQIPTGSEVTRFLMWYANLCARCAVAGSPFGTQRPEVRILSPRQKKPL